MKTSTYLTVLLVSGLLVLNSGCPLVPIDDRSLNNLDDLPDVDEDGFRDLEGPEDAVDTIAVKVVNEITKAEAIAAAEQIAPELPTELANLVTVTVNFTITRIYADGSEFVDEGSRGLVPFEIMVEAACPEQVVTVVDVVASAPFVAPFSVVVPPPEITLNLGDGSGNTFACGQVVSVTARLNEETGLPDIDLSVEDQGL